MVLLVGQVALLLLEVSVVPEVLRVPEVQVMPEDLLDLTVQRPVLVVAS